MTQEPISMGKIGGFKSKSRTIILTTIAVTILFAVVLFSTEGIKNIFNQNTAPGNAQIVTLKDVVIAYAPETKRIIFLDRNTGQVQFSLSDSVSMAIFALKSSEIVGDYSSSLTNKK